MHIGRVVQTGTFHASGHHTHFHIRLCHNTDGISAQPIQMRPDNIPRRILNRNDAIAAVIHRAPDTVNAVVIDNVRSRRIGLNESCSLVGERIFLQGMDLCTLRKDMRWNRFRR